MAAVLTPASDAWWHQALGNERLLIRVLLGKGAESVAIADLPAMLGKSTRTVRRWTADLLAYGIVVRVGQHHVRLAANWQDRLPEVAAARGTLGKAERQREAYEASMRERRRKRVEYAARSASTNPMLDSNGRGFVLDGDRACYLADVTTLPTREDVPPVGDDDIPPSQDEQRPG